MSWIETIDYAASAGRLRRVYDRVRTPAGYVDNILQAHSLRPHSLEGHMALYKSVLHHVGNGLPEWLLETVGVYVSLLNQCGYCVAHHRAGLARLVDDESRAAAICAALVQETFDEFFEPRETALLMYARKLTLAPASLVESDVHALREAGLTDGEILEVNQVASYFAYANRTVLGLGVTIDGEQLGLAPRASDDPARWTHS